MARQTDTAALLAAACSLQRAGLWSHTEEHRARIGRSSKRSKKRSCVRAATIREERREEKGNILGRARERELNTIRMNSVVVRKNRPSSPFLLSGKCGGHNRFNTLHVQGCPIQQFSYYSASASPLSLSRCLARCLSLSLAQWLSLYV